MPNADRLIEIYHRAKILPAGPERNQFLEKECQSDVDLREVTSLLESHQLAGDYLQNALFGPRFAQTEVLGELIGRYKLLEKIGEGGCGVVYVAEQAEPMRRKVALKVIKLGMDTKQVIARFEAERQALAMMDSPYIAKVLDGGSTQTGRPYFVMEFVPGVAITTYCNENRLSIRQRLDLFIKVCGAIQHAHQKGIIHRDIKPSNILVTLDDGVPVPRVIDFGIAKAIEGRLTEGTVYTQFLHFVGTPAYMSPEQAEFTALDIDTRSDIYSLGVLLYELLTGQPPFDGQKLIASGLDAMRKTIRETEPTRPSTKLSETLAAGNARKLTSQLSLRLPHSAIDADLDCIVMKCLEKSRSRRYGTAIGLAIDLSRHLRNEPVGARPPSPAYKLRKALRRNRLAFTAASAVAIALLAGSSISIWQAVEAHRARNDALNESVKARTAQGQAEKAQKAEQAEKLLAQRDSYIANMNSMGQAWEHNNYLMVRHLLAATRPSPHRGFEWYYWQRQTHLHLSATYGHVAPIRSIAFFGDGHRIITGSDDTSARVWDAATAQQLFPLLGHRAGVNAVGVSPDGTLLATASSDRTVKIWEASSGRPLHTLTGHSSSVTALAFSPDGARVLTGSSNGTLRIQEFATARQLLNVQAHPTLITSVAYAPDGATLVSCSWDGTARVSLSSDGTELFPRLRGHTKPVFGVAFSPNGRNILTASEDAVVKFWDAQTGTELPLRLATAHPIAALACSTDGRRILTGSWSSTATVWNATNAQAELLIRGHGRGLHAVAISPDGTRVATGGGDHTVKVWDADESPVQLRVGGNLTNSILAVAISPDGKLIATGSGTLRNDGNVSGSGKQALQIWDVESRKLRLVIPAHDVGISSVAFSPDGVRILSGSGDHTAKVCYTASGELLTHLRGHTSAVTSVAYFPDGERVVTGSHDHSARVWNSRTGAQLFILPGHTAPISAVAVSANGQHIATGSFDETTRLWEAATGAPVRTLKTSTSRVYSLAFSPASDRIAIAGWGLPTVWELTSTNQNPVSLYGHSVPIASITFSPDGQRILTGSMDSTARLWEADTGRELLTLLGHTEWVYSVAISSDGQRIVTGSKDQTVRLWEAATKNQVAAWEEKDRAGLEKQAAARQELAAFEQKYEQAAQSTQ